MTLDEFIVLHRNQAEKFRMYHIQGAKKFNWPTEISLAQWQDRFKKWQLIYNEWLKECGVE
jgi:hypothetical protein